MSRADCSLPAHPAHLPPLPSQATGDGWEPWPELGRRDLRSRRFLLPEEETMNHEQTQADLELLLDWIDALRRCPGRQPGAIRQRGRLTESSPAARTLSLRAEHAERVLGGVILPRTVLTERLDRSYPPVLCYIAPRWRMHRQTRRRPTHRRRGPPLRFSRLAHAWTRHVRRSGPGLSRGLAASTSSRSDWSL